MTRPDLNAIEARANAATHGPWTAERGEVEELHFGPMEMTQLDAPSRNLFAVAGLPLADAEFMAHARADIPALISEIRALLDIGYVILPDVSEHARTVGDIRAAIDGLPDEAQVFVNVSGHAEDYAIDEVWASEQIPDGEPWPTDKRVIGLEIHLGRFPEPPAADGDAQ